MPGASPTWKLEPEYETYFQDWVIEPSPRTNKAFLDALTPTVYRLTDEIVGSNDPMARARARAATLDALPRYDPAKAPLKTHLRQQLQGLKRQTRQGTEVVRYPEQQLFDAQALRQIEEDMTDELGREPSEGELMKRLRFSPRRMQKARAFRTSMAEGVLSDIDPHLPDATALAPDPKAYWTDLVYEELSPLDQKIMEHTLGLYGKKPMANQQIAAMLDRSPGYISQRKKLIQAKLDREPELRALLP